MSAGEERKVPKIVIPKIVLKVGGRSESTNSPVSSTESGRLDYVFSSRAKEFHEKFEGTILPGISLSAMTMKLIQFTYRSIENSLELMSQMRDIERKKTVHQAIFNLVELFRKLYFLSEWTKVRSEHLLLKSLIGLGGTARRNLSQISHHYNVLSYNYAHCYFNPLHFRFYMNSVQKHPTCPVFFPASIWNLSSAYTKENSQLTEVWVKSLEVFLRSEFAKAVLNIQADEIENVHFEKENVTFQALRAFEITLTIVPPKEVDSHNLFSWFVMRIRPLLNQNYFGNSLTGVFQARHNYTSCTNFLPRILSDFHKFVDIFYFEKLFSQFSYISSQLGKSICEVSKSGEKSFLLSVWFFNESISIGILDSVGLHVKSNYQDLFCANLVFNENESWDILRELFNRTYLAELHQFLKEFIAKAFILKYEVHTEGRFSIHVFGGVVLELALSPFERRLKPKLIVSGSDNYELDSILVIQLEKFFISLDTGDFVDFINNFRTFVYEIVVSDFIWPNWKAVKAPSITSRLCIALSSANSNQIIFVLKFDSISNLRIQPMRLVDSRKSGIVGLHFENTSDQISVLYPKDIDDLLELIDPIAEQILRSSSSYCFRESIESLGMNGIFESPSVFRVLSVGTSFSIDSIKLVENLDKEEYYAVFEPSHNANISPFQSGGSMSVEDLARQVSSIVRLISIIDHLKFAKSDFETNFCSDSLLVEIMSPSVNFGIAIEPISCKLQISGTLPSDRIESILNSEDFNLYSFIECVSSEITSDASLATNKNHSSASADGWFSSAFM